MNEFQKLNVVTSTENGDVAYKTTGNELLDILFFAPYLNKNTNQVHIGNSEKEKVFSMMMRDPRYGLGYRDLGLDLLIKSGATPEEILMSGRAEDLMHATVITGEMAYLDLLVDEAKKGNELAKKWLPRLNANSKGSNNQKIARLICKQYGMSEKEYRALIKSDTVERKLSHAEEVKVSDLEFVFGETKYKHPLISEINYEHVPSLAMLKHYSSFMKKDGERFQAYLDGVKSGDKKLNISVTTPYDLYLKKDEIDVDLFFEKLPKIEINCLPVLDTSASMMDSNDSFGKAMAIAHYLSKCSTYAKDKVVSFSSEPRLLTLGKSKPQANSWYSRDVSSLFHSKSIYGKELLSMYTGDISVTDLGATMELLSNLNDTPEYLVILSDMQFNQGSSMSKDRTVKLWKEKGYKTKIVWWNFNSRSASSPEIDEHGNIFMSGYSPQLLQFLESGFDGNAFLDRLITEYRKKVIK